MGITAQDITYTQECKTEILDLYFGMSKSMQKAVKNIMLVANGKEIEDERETTM